MHDKCTYYLGAEAAVPHGDRNWPQTLPNDSLGLEVIIDLLNLKKPANKHILKTKRNWTFAAAKNEGTPVHFKRK